MKSDEQKKISIPERHQEICRQIAKIAKDNGLTRLSGKYSDYLGNDWDGDISFNWDAGRHGADSNRLYITSEFRVNTLVDENDPRYKDQP